MAAKRGFTLIESIIAITIFTILTAALAAAMNVALSSDALTRERQNESGSVRAIFDSMTRDIQAAFASPNSPASVFIAGSGSAGTGSGNNIAGNGLLTLTTLTQHIQASSLTSDQTTDPSQVSTTPDAPQSDMALVQYTLEQQNNGSTVLRRYVLPVPNTQQITTIQQQPTDSNNPYMPTKYDLADNVVDMNLQFYDRQQQTWRTDWDYEQQNQQTSTQGNTPGGGANGANGANGNNNATQNTTSGDSVLPGSVKVVIHIRKKNGDIAEYSTTIPIVAPQPQPATNAIPTSSSSNTGTSPGG